MGDVLCQGVGGTQWDRAPSCPFPHLSAQTLAHWVPAQPSRDEEPEHTCANELLFLLPGKVGKGASLASQSCCGDKHVSDCIYLDIIATQAREQTIHSAFRYTAPVCEAENEHGS